MNETPAQEGLALPPQLRFLKLLVTVLAGTMIVGLITIIGLLVTRLPGATGPAPALPDNLALPDGAQAQAVTLGRGWVAVVTDGDQILVFDADTGALLQTVEIRTTP